MSENLSGLLQMRKFWDSELQRTQSILEPPQIPSANQSRTEMRVEDVMGVIARSAIHPANSQNATFDPKCNRAPG